MDYVAIEKKWKEIWAKEKVGQYDENKPDKFYMLEMFSYPSGANLHLGHWYNFALSDSFARYKKMCGYNVFEPMGFDAFGLPAENYAIKTGIHPQTSTDKNIEIMEKQLREMGAIFDWDHEVVTCRPEYYKWTQWLFLQLYKKGLAYRKEAPVNWCPSCQTVLANEQATDGVCERCGSAVVKKNLTQWFFKITDYAEELLDGLDGLKWPEKTKLMQKNWIGKSVGGEVEFILSTGDKVKVFTTRADTLYGVTYIVLAPEHPLVDKITTQKQRKAVDDYISEVNKSSEIDRLSTAKEKTGVFTGAFAVNPINGKTVEVWIGDYVLYSYGTGAVMGVPAHDARDFDFAKKYGLDIIRVIKGKEGVNDELPFVEYGIMVDSGTQSGLTSDEGKLAVIKVLEKQGKGELKTNYRLRDWLISRQRYWGAPIPVVYCEHCGIVPVPEEQLPVKLPFDVNFTPDGTSPLLKHEGYMNTECPICHGKAKRDPDTLDTFVCSSWYYLRYTDNKDDKMPFSREKADKLCPVDMYVGGAEHACMHLLYARFITKALRDMGYIDFDEPFTALTHQGMILGADGQKMSKRNSSESPDELIHTYGSDALRTYLGFGFKYIEGGPWNKDGIKAISKWFDRVQRLVDDAVSAEDTEEKAFTSAENELNCVLNNTIKCVLEDYEIFSFNTAVARMMELVNALYRYDREGMNGKLFRESVRSLILLLAPLAPHICEEFWHNLGFDGYLVEQRMPTYDSAALVKPEVEIALQINSKIRGKLTVDSSFTKEELEKHVAECEQVVALLDGKQIKKIIAIPGRLVNLIVG
ncbi:MAG: leucine--tRNA ligase [Clostridia bacterium]|nr:leucine--tRNA ligase [Clostridia bacterium]